MKKMKIHKETLLVVGGGFVAIVLGKIIDFYLESPGPWRFVIFCVFFLGLLKYTDHLLGPAFEKKK